MKWLCWISCHFYAYGHDWTRLPASTERNCIYCRLQQFWADGQWITLRNLSGENIYEKG